MARRPRLVLPDCAHHVTQRGNNHQRIFHCDADRTRYLELLGRQAAIEGVRFCGYCLMSNHVHIVAVPAQVNSLSRLFQRAHAEYAQWFNWKYQKCGHLWQNRYYSCPLSRRHFGAALRYVELNPVRAGMVQRAEDWPWSSARAHCGSGETRLALSWIEGEEICTPAEWREWLGGADAEEVERMRTCTRGGWAFGEREFVEAVERKTGCPASPQPEGRPRRRAAGMGWAPSE